jgi:phosphoglycerate kinase
MQTLDRLDLRGRRVFIRVDFNVPLAEGRVTDNSRIVEAIPTIRHALSAGGRVILASHLGRPKGKPNAALSLAPAAKELERLLGQPVLMVQDCIGSATEDLVRKLRDGDVAMLENLRFHPEEEANDPEFARRLAALADVYVNDAFGAAHRAHASTTGITRYVRTRAAGFLMKREVEMLGGLMKTPARPFVAIVGGAKVSDKIELLGSLIDRTDAVLVGGAMAYSLLSAQGHEVGTSRVEAEKLDLARNLLARAKARGVALELPVDHVAAREFKEDAEPIVVDTPAIGSGLMGLDIGPRTRQRYADMIRKAATVFWNGPMGVFEWARFAEGTMTIARAVADSAATSVVGGGDSVAALAKSGRTADITHVSTGGGASLELLEGRTLPGVAALEEAPR